MKEQPLQIRNQLLTALAPPLIILASVGSTNSRRATSTTAIGAGVTISTISTATGNDALVGFEVAEIVALRALRASSAARACTFLALART